MFVEECQRTFDKGLEYNAWLEYEWDTVLEFCQMILETKNYANADITPYLPLIESSLTFFDEHYQQLASRRGRKALDGNVSFISMYRNGIGGIVFSISFFFPYVSNTTFKAAMVLLALLVILYVSQAEPGKRIRCPLPSNAFRPRREASCR